MDGVDDFLNGAELEPEAIEADAPEAEVEAEPEAIVPVRDERGRFAPKGEQPETPEPSAPPALEEPQHTIPPKALQEERRKRQELEQRYADLEHRLNAMNQQPAAPAPDIFEDADGYFNHRLSQTLPQIKEAILEEIRVERVRETSEEARSKYADFDDKVSTFADMVRVNPALEKQMLAAKNPAEFAYSTAKAQMDLAQYGSLDALVAARVKEELAKAQPAAPAPSIPESLADAQSARSSTVTQAPLSLDDILGRKA